MEVPANPVKYRRRKRSRSSKLGLKAWVDLDCRACDNVTVT